MRSIDTHTCRLSPRCIQSCAQLADTAIYGYVRAATVVNQNLTISEYATQDKLASSLSLTMIMKGVFVMTIGQLLGNEIWKIDEILEN